MKFEITRNAVEGTTESNGHLRWMYVEDNEPVAKSLTALLKNLGVGDLQRFTSAEDALDVFKSQPNRFQCVITGLNLPGMDGVELCRELHRIVPALRILLAARGGIIDHDDARQLGFSGFITRPFLATQVWQEIEGIAAAQSHLAPDNRCNCNINS